MPFRKLLVIPHYRDTERLEPFLVGLLMTLSSDFSILVSDDGSGAEGFARLQRLIEVKRTEHCENSLNAPILLPPITSSENRGKGFAVYSGWATAGGDFDILGFADADGAVSPLEIKRANAYLEQHFDAIDFLIGSRVKMLGRLIERRLLRHITGRTFATLVAVLTRLQVYDSQCGMKFIKQSSFKAIHPYCQSYGFAFDVELILLTEKLGFRAEEFPVDWHDVSGSKVSVISDSLPMLIEIVKLARRLNSDSSIPKKQ